MKQRSLTPPMPLVRRRPPSGDGEDSPIAGVYQDASAAEGAVEIPAELIDRSPYQPRLRMVQARIEELAENIEATGKLFMPIRVRRKDGGRFELIAGERRLTAIRLLKWPTITAVIREVSEEEAKLETYVENLGREDLTPFETALIIKDMLESGMAKTQREVARKTALSAGTISMYVAYFDLPADSMAILREQPDLIGLRDGYELARLVKAGHATLVSEAVKLAANGKIKASGAVRWVNEHLTERVRNRAERRVYQSAGGREVCTLSRSGEGKLMVVGNQEHADKIEEIIEKALADFAASIDHQDSPNGDAK